MAPFLLQMSSGHGQCWHFQMGFNSSFLPSEFGHRAEASGKMRHHGTNGKNDGTMEGIPMDLDERIVKP
jgi:hypothetical protein